MAQETLKQDTQPPYGVVLPTKKVDMQKQGLWSLLLSHHPSDQLHLCYSFKIKNLTIYGCARCLGLFPVMFGVLIVGQMTGTWPFWLEGLLLFVAPLPALLDWGTTTATGKPERSNIFRFSTGLGLGASLGANLHINSYALLSIGIRAQLLMFLAVVWLVWTLNYLQRKRKRTITGRKERSHLTAFLLESEPFSKEAQVHSVKNPSQKPTP